MKLRSEACNFIKKETLAQVPSCEFCEISKDTFSNRTPLVAASATHWDSQQFADLNAEKTQFVPSDQFNNCGAIDVKMD